MTDAGKVSAVWITEKDLEDEKENDMNMFKVRNRNEIIISLSANGAGKWKYISDQIETRRRGESRGGNRFSNLWTKIEDLMGELRSDTIITIIWPTRSAYWRDPRVKALINQRN